MSSSHPTTDEHLENIEKYLDSIKSIKNHADRVRMISLWLQPEIGYLLRSVVDDARKDGVTWMAIGGAADTSYTALCRQFQSHGPMLSSYSRPRHAGREGDPK